VTHLIVVFALLWWSWTKPAISPRYALHYLISLLPPWVSEFKDGRDCSSLASHCMPEPSRDLLRGKRLLLLFFLMIKPANRTKDTYSSFLDRNCSATTAGEQSGLQRAPVCCWICLQSGEPGPAVSQTGAWCSVVIWQQRRLSGSCLPPDNA
jgi:hypothetical protein